jgi:hypothetical protein
MYYLFGLISQSRAIASERNAFLFFFTIIEFRSAVCTYPGLLHVYSMVGPDDEEVLFVM